MIFLKTETIHCCFGIFRNDQNNLSNLSFAQFSLVEVPDKVFMEHNMHGLFMPHMSPFALFLYDLIYI